MQIRPDVEQSDDSSRAAAFPAAAPESPTNEESIRENDWEAFQDVDLMENHWGRTSDSSASEAYYWYLTFDDPDLIAATERCQKNLDIDGLDLVPLDGLHITLMPIGSTDHVTDADIQAIADSANEYLDAVRSFRLSVGPLAGSRGAVRFSVSPWSELLDLHRITGKAIAEVLPDAYIAQTSNFRPHLGIGYSNRRQSAEPLISRVCKLRDVPPVTVDVNAIRIVRLRREGRAYRWDDVAVIELAATDV
ncbi:2'-5' RNA ligase family protein [Nocardia sp. NBC_01503]|uniref:2'-5' RNA ligase family protein n=1 Tax=Nocardia sp. NBC_01503 TaxID=2975997 RepID=UPI002E7BEB31|nr:2'-5' RNA ligase family protein [Nocardia sp. NBC_01503]WTL33257.1 2'-5' RNA ligase family protein [Nocardia sp. NBC_01503]